MDEHDKRDGQNVFERVEKGEDAEGDLEAERERDDSADVHEGGDSVVQERKHHDERAGPRPKPGRVDLQDAGGYDKPVAAEVVLHRSLVRLPMEGVKPNADKDLHSPGCVRGLGKRQHLPSTVRAAKGYKTPAPECGGTGSGGPRGRQIDSAGRRESGNRRERVIVISITGREPRSS